ncbi:hypothetical protein L1049_027527 [Liquidambar formosana]|uniref:RING-type E3 ubiquitin transferase n=1 Tax=Liquidambar formosana TaxID=63359 RepID=A0AAP0RJ95_LIQFO
MSRIASQLKQKDELLIHPPPPSPLSSFSYPYSSTNYEKEPTPPSSSSVTRISPVLLLVIVILAIIFFVSGLLHLLVRCLMKRPPSSSIYNSNRYPETSTSHALQRQLQQLFRLHDSGLDQAFIDALPVFHYKDIMGLKEPFDCAVCLSEFSDRDKLRLLPTCSHAFHIYCIDTWLLSNSTCPLCRGTLLSSGLPMQNPVFNFDDSRELSTGFPSDGEQNGFSCGQKPHKKPVIVEETAGVEKRVFPVRLGKYRSLNGGGESGEGGQGETSSSNLDARRCYSMGSFQYVVGDSYLQVALSSDTIGGASDVKLVKVKSQHGNSSVNEDVEGKKISSRSKGESFSVSKIWLWSKKNRYPSSLHTQISVPSSLHVNLPLTDST